MFTFGILYTNIYVRPVFIFVCCNSNSSTVKGYCIVGFDIFDHIHILGLYLFCLQL